MVNDKQIDPVTMGFRNITIIIVIIQLFAPIHALAMRFNYYLIIYLPLLISKVISRPKAELKNIAQLAHIVIVIFFTGYFFINAYTGEDILQVFPYKFFWN